MLQYACHTAMLVKCPCDPWEHEIGLDNVMDITWLEPHHQTEKPFISATKVRHCDAIGYFMVRRHIKRKRKSKEKEACQVSSGSDRAGEHVRRKTSSVVGEQLQCSGSSACLNKTDVKLTDSHFERDESRPGGGDGATQNTNTVMAQAFANIPCHPCNCFTQQSLSNLW